MFHFPQKKAPLGDLETFLANYRVETSLNFDKHSHRNQIGIFSPTSRRIKAMGIIQSLKKQRNTQQLCMISGDIDFRVLLLVICTLNFPEVELEAASQPTTLYLELWLFTFEFVPFNCVFHNSQVVFITRKIIHSFHTQMVKY